MSTPQIPEKNEVPGFWEYIISFFAELIDLQDGIDKEGTIINIKNNKRMHGSNAWLLMCSIMIASLGLDLNSPAILIGAMLISPLMAPILGVGLAMGTNDWDTLKISAKHFGLSIAIALATSIFYFSINPLGQFEATDQILLRTQPNLLDGLVAIFGGIAGIISISRKDKSNAIPGVAIATALMPPLCVAGYGFSRGEWIMASNAFYLFFLNSFFIAGSTWVMIRIMGFHVKSFQDPKTQRRTTFAMLLLTICITGPSIYLLYIGYANKQKDYIVERFVDEYFGEDDDPQAMNYNYTPAKDTSILALQLLGIDISQERLSIYEKELKSRGIANVKIYAVQDLSLDLAEFDRLQQEIDGYKSIVTKLELAKDEKSNADLKIELLQAKIDSIQSDTIPIWQITNEAKIFFTELQTLGYGTVDMRTDSGMIKKYVVYAKWDDKIKQSKLEDSIEELERFLTVRTGISIKVNSAQILN